MPEPDPQVRALTDAVNEMKVANATLSATVQTVQAALTRIERALEQHVTRREFDELKADVEGQADNWRKIAWFIGLAVAGALLTLILTQGQVQR